METNKDHFCSAKIALQKGTSKKKKFYFQEKSEKNANNSMELWKALTFLRMKWGKVSQSKISWKNDGATQFEPKKNVDIFKDFYSEKSLVRSCQSHLTNLTNLIIQRSSIT